MGQWRIDSAVQTIVFAASDGMPSVIYWGPVLPAGEDLSVLAAAAQMDVTGGMIDVLPEMTLTPEPGRAFQGQPGLVVADASGAPLSPCFVFESVSVDDGILSLTSRSGGLTLTHSARPTSSGVIALKTVLESDTPVRVDWLCAPAMPGTQQAEEMIDIAGRWTGEFQLVHTPWSAGIRMREARTGRSGHEHPPYIIVPEVGCTNTKGTAFALHYGWSGGHRMVAEELADGRRQIQFGHAAWAETEAGTRFETAELFAAFSNTGLNGIGKCFQRHIRDDVVQWPIADRMRPVHYNCWEAIYFDHNFDDLAEIAKMAADLGAERFVLDDGWFGKRDDDTTSLGDWTIDVRKWPDGLGPLIDEVKRLGMTFGLWFEPEMVNPESDLYRAHPDWVLGPADQVLGRQQLVLDMSRQEVQDYLFEAVSAILEAYDIDYVKWDHNRLLPVVDAAQARGTYALFDRIRAAHPMVELESCASGGGRIDAGILARTHRVWLSDSNDAHERLRMQHEAALFLPAAITGSHVGPYECHTSGRILPMRYRAWVAAQRHMGFEMDLRKLEPKAAAILQDVTFWWKANRDWLLAGDIQRLDTVDPEVRAEMVVAQDGGHFVVMAGHLGASKQIFPRPLQLTGLEPDVMYQVKLRNPEDVGALSRNANLPIKLGALTMSGQALMSRGLQMPVTWPATMWVIEGERV